MSQPDRPQSLTPLADGLPIKSEQNGFDQSHDSTSRNDAILQGKQKAKAVVAASMGAEPSQSPARVPTKSPSRGTDGLSSSNAPASRKRSRSGSRISNASRPMNASDGPQPLTEDVPWDLWTTREILHSDAQISAAEQWDKLVEIKREERKICDDLSRSRVEAMRMAPRIVYPDKRKRPWNRSSRALKLSRKIVVAQAERSEDLVPIRLDVELEKLRLRDTFTWNLHDCTVPEELFAETLIEDFQIPSDSRAVFAQQIYASMKEQIEDYHPHPFLAHQDEEPLDSHLPYTTYKDDEMRIQIRLNITIGQHNLIDQFDWDINNSSNSPEEFAQHMVQDLSLTGEFMTAIAHSIREQTQLFTKSLYISGHPFDGRPVEDADVKDSLLPSPLPTVFRSFNSAKDNAPTLWELTEADVERNEHAFSREQRQQKRSVTRRGGPALPDLKDRLKTWRTQVVSSLIPGAVETLDASGIYKYKHTATGKARKPWKGDRGEDSEESEDEESEIDSPAIAQLQGTSRTRGMRGAASAAQAAMRANLARSQTPEISLHHHETRTLARRFGVYEHRDESSDKGPSLLLRFKLPRERFRQWWRNYKATHPDYMKPKPSNHLANYGSSQSNTPVQTPMTRPMPPPTSTPSTAAMQRPGLAQGQPNRTPSNEQHGFPEGPSPTPPAQGVSEAPHLHAQHPNQSPMRPRVW